MLYRYYQPYWLNNVNELEHFGIKGMKWGYSSVSEFRWNFNRGWKEKA